MDPNYASCDVEIDSPRVQTAMADQIKTELLSDKQICNKIQG